MTQKMRSETFEKVFDNEKLYLPIRWDGVDFTSTVDSLLNHYVKQLEKIGFEDSEDTRIIQSVLDSVKKVCTLLKTSIEQYLCGYPSRAYDVFTEAMKILKKNPLLVRYEDEEVALFRVVIVDDNKPYTRERVFHTPYDLRSKVSTARYSIAGYPSLYLGTCLELCCEEIHLNPHKNFAITAKFKFEQKREYTNVMLHMYDLAIKPQDFLKSKTSADNKKRTVAEESLQDEQIRTAYLLWYPLIAVSSYIRVNKNDPFAAEYIIPQLLMQWARQEMNSDSLDPSSSKPWYERLVGIRYFSCASAKASDMGFDYVFPISGKREKTPARHCPVLAKMFRLTPPIYIQEYDSISACEDALRENRDYDRID